MTDLIPAGNIIRKIFMIRDFGGMMDRDQAEIYGVKKAKIKGAALNENQAYIHITLAAFRSGHFFEFQPVVSQCKCSIYLMGLRQGEESCDIIATAACYHENPA